MDVDKKHLLFVDDEVSILEMFERMLHSESKAWRLHFAQSVDEAVQITSQYDLDVIVTDVKMPGKGGFDFLRSLRASKRTCNIPTIVVTGDSEPTLKRRALDLGATDLLTKPVCPEDLLARIRNALRLKSYEDRLEQQVETLDGAVKERTGDLAQSQREIIWRLAKASEYRDDETGNHVVRVACYARAIAGALQTDKDFLEAIFLASALHDVGKIGVPDSILLKPGPLTQGEREEMQKHCLIGAGILMHEPRAMRVCRKRGYGGSPSDHDTPKNPLLRMAVIIAKHHHEKWDGSGYPAGLSKGRIPLEARIVALADVYDALTTERRYKPAFSREKALETVREEAGRHFDPQIVAAVEPNLAEVTAIHAEPYEAELCWSP
jgi:response regulator RpfG family c-di-GMP phosphodiesterase